MDVKGFRSIDQDTKDSVNGFIRKIQKSFPANQTYYNIPSSINDICILFFHIYDSWDPIMMGKRIDIVNETKLFMKAWKWQNAFLSKMIETGKCIWRFKLHKNNCLVIGIWDCKHDSLRSKVVDDFLDFTDGKAYV